MSYYGDMALSAANNVLLGGDARQEMHKIAVIMSNGGVIPTGVELHFALLALVARVGTLEDELLELRRQIVTLESAREEGR